MMKTKTLLLSSLLALGLGACEGAPSPEPVPAEPTWARDVLPILRGNCFGCHASAVKCDERGRPVGCKSSLTSWYVYDKKDFEALGEITGGPMLGASEMGAMTLILQYVKATDPLMRMPPAPAEPLSDRDIEVLEKFAANPMKGEHAPNRRPAARLVRKRMNGDKLEVTVDVVDGNDDQVLGKIRAGEAEASVPATGRHVLTFDGASMTTELSYTLSDGWATTNGLLR